MDNGKYTDLKPGKQEKNTTKTDKKKQHKTRTYDNISLQQEQTKVSKITNTKTKLRNQHRKKTASKRRKNLQITTTQKSLNTTLHKINHQIT